MNVTAPGRVVDDDALVEVAGLRRLDARGAPDQRLVERRHGTRDAELTQERGLHVARDELRAVGEDDPLAQRERVLPAAVRRLRDRPGEVGDEGVAVRAGHALPREQAVVVHDEELPVRVVVDARVDRAADAVPEHRERAAAVRRVERDRRARRRRGRARTRSPAAGREAGARTRDREDGDCEQGGTPRGSCVSHGAPPSGAASAAPIAASRRSSSARIDSRWPRSDSSSHGPTGRAPRSPRSAASSCHRFGDGVGWLRRPQLAAVSGCRRASRRAIGRFRERAGAPVVADPRERADQRRPVIARERVERVLELLDVGRCLRVAMRRRAPCGDPERLPADGGEGRATPRSRMARRRRVQLGGARQTGRRTLQRAGPSAVVEHRRGLGVRGQEQVGVEARHAGGLLEVDDRDRVVRRVVVAAREALVPRVGGDSRDALDEERPLLRARGGRVHAPAAREPALRIGGARLRPRPCVQLGRRLDRRAQRRMPVRLRAEMEGDRRRSTRDATR